MPSYSIKHNITNPTAYGVCRRSRESADAIPIEVQEKSIREFHARTLSTMPLVIIVDDHVSGSIPVYTRPGTSRLLTDLRRGDHVIAAKVDRWSRSVADGALVLLDFRDRGVALHLVDLPVDLETHSGRMIYHIMLSVAEWEREQIGSRIRASKKHRRHNRLPTNHLPPIGWKIVTDEAGAKSLVPDAASRRRCRRLVARNDAGEGYHRIADSTSIPRSTCRRMILAAREGFPTISSNCRRWGSESCQPGKGVSRLLEALRHGLGQSRKKE